MRFTMRDAPCDAPCGVPWRRTTRYTTRRAKRCIIAMQDKGAHATTNVKSLSGGEQAFTTLSLALAMWQFSQSPVRAMSEAATPCIRAATPCIRVGVSGR